jgi:pimeloyl-ACP methyl ester carboxylesterase
MPYSGGIFYRLYNEADLPASSRPLLLLHGSGGSHMAWPVDMRRSLKRRVIALDLPGHGKSAEMACQRLPSLVQSLLCFLDNLSIYEMDLAGHSLGALLALSAAQALQKRARSLLLLSCGSHFGIPDSLFDSLLCPHKKNQFIEDFSRLAFYEEFPQSQRRVLLAPLGQVRTSTLLADLSICAEFRLNGNFQKIACPILMVNGGNDLITTPAAARELAHNLSQAELEVLPKCGHLLLYEKTASISKLMRGFFNSL